MDKFNPPDPLILDENIREHWKHWIQELELYLVATKKEEKENKVTPSINLSCIRPHQVQGRELYKTFTISQEQECFDYCTMLLYKNSGTFTFLDKIQPC